ncbi:MAG: NADH-quinone oxidoreductase subunit C [Patescibacteria group bacterium]|jgi:Ni,Fe-hydrogenase III large subunit/Ni,Fe-hydrogenase III component G
MNETFNSFEVPVSDIVSVCRDLRDGKKLSLKFITATDERKEDGCFKIWYVFGSTKEEAFTVPFIRLTDTDEFPSITSVAHEAWDLEKKIQTFFGLKPMGHPDKRPLILHENWPTGVYPLRKDFAWDKRPGFANGEYNFQLVEGEGIYEIPVGPIHAGIIEPGHFRFSVAGEEIMLLEPRLGYTHKGSEKLFEHLPLKDKVRLSEKISGDSSFSHSLAFCQSVEQLGGIKVQKRARYLRCIYAELERLANHFGDIGAMMLDTGYSFGGSQGARLREMMMQINERLTGSRFLRGVNAIGGVTKDIDPKQKKQLAVDLDLILEDFSEVIEIAENSASLLNRLRGTGMLPRDVARSHGVVGVTARAVGESVDTRVDHPYAAYGEIPMGEIPTEDSGDAYARFFVRVREVYSSIKIIHKALHQMPEDRLALPTDVSLKPNTQAISCVEGWRGEIMYFVTTDSSGNISRVAPRDPSFLNWAALGHAGLGNIVPDFPLINKSFNLSYTGNDL